MIGRFAIARDWFASKNDMPTAHIINHTHWDREWFLTSEYTTAWVPRLIDRLTELSAENPHFRYFFDGQTLVVEDLLAAYPAYRPKIAALIQSGCLTIGPYYCQPDWKLTGGELLLRNLELGRQDVAQFGAPGTTGWLVDTFGHISQAPQIHRLNGLDAVYVWRGAPQLTPYFNWVGADRSVVLGVNLFGGYRNLYGVTHAPEVALPRLLAEIDKLAPYYPTPDMPLFDGYDLEDNPEDPVRFYGAQPAAGMDVVEATPTQFVSVIRPKISPPTVRGELNSGKYGATFPGTLSARTYLKVMAYDCACLLHHVCEPLLTLAHLRGATLDAPIEAWDRRLLQNAVHDCICGVSIDQVHEKMEDGYRRVFDGARGATERALAVLLADFAPGLYAVSVNPFPFEGSLAAGEWTYTLQTGGLGVWPVGERHALPATLEGVASLERRKGYYPQVWVTEEGVVKVGGVEAGRLMVSAEAGDTYSDETGPVLGIMRPTAPPHIIAAGSSHIILAYTCAFEQGDSAVSAAVRLTLDDSPLLRWQIDLDSRGSDLRIDFVVASGFDGRVYVGMPFDVTARESADTDLLPRDLPDDLAHLLLGQREVGAVTTFPFHDFVALHAADQTAVLFAQGLHSYQSDGRQLRLTLRRAVEWLTRPDLSGRVGDAGPFFYVPGARCERLVRHEIALALGDFDPQGMALQRLNHAYHHPPLLVRVTGAGEQTQWHWPGRDLPLSSLRRRADGVEARWYNPSSYAHDGAAPGQIITTRSTATAGSAESQPGAAVEWLNPPVWRVGPDHNRPDPVVVARLGALSAGAQAAAEAAEAQRQAASDSDRLRWQRQVYVHQREQLEYALSQRLNQLKLAQADVLDPAYLYRPDREAARLGAALNQLRIKRRIFDYVVAALPD